MKNARLLSRPAVTLSTSPYPIVLTVTPPQIKGFAQQAERKFLAELQPKLENDEPALLPRFPLSQRASITRNVYLRGQAAGATWQSSLGAWGGYMVAIAPNIGSDPAVRAWLASAGPSPDEVINGLPDRLTEADWQRIDRNRCDMPLFVPPSADRLTLRDKVAIALPIVLWDHVEAATAKAYADAAVAAAARQGMAALEDAPVALMAWRLLYGDTFNDQTLGWPADVTATRHPAPTRLAMLRARIMLDHGRWA